MFRIECPSWFVVPAGFPAPMAWAQLASRWDKKEFILFCSPLGLHSCFPVGAITSMATRYIIYKEIKCAL